MQEKIEIFLKQYKWRKIYNQYNHESKVNGNSADMVNRIAQYYEKRCDAKEKASSGSIRYQRMVSMFEREIEKLETKLATTNESKEMKNDESDGDDSLIVQSNIVGHHRLPKQLN